VIGFDTETRPSFKKGEVYLPCLVQVATARAVYLLQLARLEVFPALVELLAKPDLVKTGISLAYDLRQLQQVFPFTVANVLDLGVIARRRGLEQSGVRNLAGLLLGFRIPKGNRTSNWAAPRLTPAQINYAATDAWACRELYLRFEQEGML
jgi:ribonuclease D